MLFGILGCLTLGWFWVLMPHLSGLSRLGAYCDGYVQRLQSGWPPITALALGKVPPRDLKKNFYIVLCDDAFRWAEAAKNPELWLPILRLFSEQHETHTLMSYQWALRGSLMLAASSLASLCLLSPAQLFHFHKSDVLAMAGFGCITWLYLGHPLSAQESMDHLTKALKDIWNSGGDPLVLRDYREQARAATLAKNHRRDFAPVAELMGFAWTLLLLWSPY